MNQSESGVHFTYLKVPPPIGSMWSSGPPTSKGPWAISRSVSPGLGKKMAAKKVARKNQVLTQLRCRSLVLPLEGCNLFTPVSVILPHASDVSVVVGGEEEQVGKVNLRVVVRFG